MGNLLYATIFIVMLNVLMWFSSIAMLDINPSGSICYNLAGTIIDNSITTSGNISVVNNDIVSQLPTAEGTVTTQSSTIFTDIFNNIIGWFKSTPGLKYIYAVVAAPYNILTCLNLPTLFVAGVGTLWYLVSLLVFLAFLWGRDY